jgi:hypothetical protein
LIQHHNSRPRRIVAPIDKARLALLKYTHANLAMRTIKAVSSSFTNETGCLALGLKAMVALYAGHLLLAFSARGPLIRKYLLPCPAAGSTESER